MYEPPRCWSSGGGKVTTEQVLTASPRARGSFGGLQAPRHCRIRFLLSAPELIDSAGPCKAPGLAAIQAWPVSKIQTLLQRRWRLHCRRCGLLTGGQHALGRQAAGTIWVGAELGNHADQCSCGMSRSSTGEGCEGSLRHEQLTTD